MSFLVEWMADPQAWLGFATLTALEIVLGVDNIVFLSILSARLPEAQQESARRIGLALALIGRLVLLFSLAWIMKLVEPLFGVLGHEISGRDLILIGGGLFLLGKATHEIHVSIEGGGHAKEGEGKASFGSILLQILLFDVVFSLDSVITAVGMVDEIGVMVCAVCVAIGFMLFTARAVSEFIDRHPTVKILALSFLLLVGVALVADGLEFHIPRGYVYFAMGFSVFVELLNLKGPRRKAKR